MPSSLLAGRIPPTLLRLAAPVLVVLTNVMLYANIVFAAAIPGWIANVRAAALRGAGNVRVPAIITAVGSLITLGVSPLLVLGWGWIPSLGVAGAGIGVAIFNVGS